MGRTACTEPQCLYSTAISLLPLWAVRPLQNLSACTVQLYLYSPQCLYSTAIPLLPSVPVQYSYTCTPSMGRTACTEPQCLYKGLLYLLINSSAVEWAPWPKIIIQFLHIILGYNRLAQIMCRLHTKSWIKKIFKLLCLNTEFLKIYDNLYTKFCNLCNVKWPKYIVSDKCLTIRYLFIKPVCFYHLYLTL